MVTADQLRIVQSPITNFISTVSTSVTVKLDDSNYLTWSFQIKLLFESHGIMRFANGSRKCPPRFDDDYEIEGVKNDDYLVWKMHDRAFMQLLFARLSTTAMSSIIGSQGSYEIWVNLTERFSTVTKATIFQMKIELQNIKKGSESVSAYLQKIKDAMDHLAAVGVMFEDDDVIILALKGLPAKFNTFKCVIRGRENGISLKDFISQLLVEEAIIGQFFESFSSLPFGTALVVGTQSNKGKALVLNQESSQSTEIGSSFGTSSQSFNNYAGGSNTTKYNFGNNSFNNYNNSYQGSYNYGG